jgi:flagellar assembly protein FliH
LSDAVVSYAFEQLEPSAPPRRDGAERLLAQAEAQAERIRERARAEGYEAGRAEGRARGAGEAASAAVALSAALEDVRALAAQTVEAVEDDAIELALALAAKVLSGALQARPELVVEVVQGALRRMSDRRRITVLVNPLDIEPVKAAIGELTAQGSGVELCDLLADERVSAGSAIVRTAEGEVDASVATQLERAREVVAASLGATEEEEEVEQPRAPSSAAEQAVAG